MRKRTCNRFISTLATMAVGAGGLLYSSLALAATYEFCLELPVQNIDSEQQAPTGIIEDYYLTSSQIMVPAWGVYVKVYNAGNLIASGYSSSSTGCFAFPEDGGNLVTDIVVYSIAKHGSSYVRAHDGGSTGSSAWPGTMYSLALPNQVLGPNHTPTLALPSGPTWNAFATGSFALSRVATGLEGKTIHMGFDNVGSSSIFPGATSWIEDNSHLIRVNNTSRRRKFEVVHEMGHAAARLNYGQNGPEDPYDVGFFYDAINLFGCDPDPGSNYSQQTVEYDSMGFKEGFANLYVARVFNDRADDGAIFLTGTPISLERFQAASLGNPQGGHLWTHCYPVDDPPHGVSTTEDWTRFLWDVYTIPTSECGSPQLGLNEMYDLYAATRDGNPARDTYHTEMIDAIEGLASLSTCEETQALAYLDWNAAGGLYHSF